MCLINFLFANDNEVARMAFLLRYNTAAVQWEEMSLSKKFHLKQENYFVSFLYYGWNVCAQQNKLCAEIYFNLLNLNSCEMEEKVIKIEYVGRLPFRGYSFVPSNFECRLEEPK